MPDLLAVAGEGIADIFAGGAADTAAAGIGEAAADVGIASTADAAVGAGVADATAAGLAADTGASLGAATALDAGTVSGLASTTAGLGAGAADTAALGGAAGSGIAGDSAALGGTLLPEQTVTAASLAPGAAAGGAGSSALGGLAAGVGAGSGIAGLASAAGGGGSGVPGTQSQPADFSNSTASNSGAGVSDTPVLNSSQFLGADDTGPSLQTLSNPSQFGITPTDAISAQAGDNPGFGSFDVADPSAGSDIESWLANPKNAATAGLLGLSLKSALTRPKLPNADTTASNAATTAVEGATSVIQSGGTATPEWASQKASIDATINQQIQQQTEAIQQAAASSGEGTANSGIVQQQIAQMTQNANVQRQNLYAQAQSQNVSAALSELSGGDSVLTSIGNTQLQQSEEAQQLAAQTAELALLLQSGTGVRLGGAGVGG
jgi:hypothetical protein